MDFSLLDAEMKRYNNMHLVDTQYDGLKKSDNNLAEYIHDNVDNMDEHEMRLFANRCLNYLEVRAILLDYDLKYYKYKQSEEEYTLSEFKKIAQKVFHKYHWKAGGLLIEDSEWTFHDSSSNKYNIKGNEILFENTVPIVDTDDYNTSFYLDKLVERLSRMSANILVEYRTKQNYKSKFMSILIWMTDKNDKRKSKISL